MKRRYSYFYNNIVYWLNRWYGISLDDKKYNGRDFAESNGRVFFRVRYSMLIETGKDPAASIPDGPEAVYAWNKIVSAKPDDWVIGFIKKMSDKATIIDVVSNTCTSGDNSDIHLTVYDHGVSYISGIDKDGDMLKIRVSCISSRYSEGYKIREKTCIIREGGDSEAGFTAVLTGNEDDDCSECLLVGKGSLYSLSDEKLKRVCEFDDILGYNEELIYVVRDDRIITVLRRDLTVSDITDLLTEQANRYIYSDTGPVRSLKDYLAFADSARGEYYFYEPDRDLCQRVNPHPGDAALIGLAMVETDKGLKTIRERADIPDAAADEDNPLIFDGYKYIWRVNNLKKGYLIFRPDGSLMSRLLVDRTLENNGSPVVFSSPTCVFVEWEGRLSYNTNRGLCRMFMLDEGDKCIELSADD